MPDTPDTPDNVRCERCGMSPADLAREGRVPTVRRGPGSARMLCNLHWADERPSWHVGPRND